MYYIIKELTKDPEIPFLDRKLQAEIDLATHHLAQEQFANF